MADNYIYHPLGEFAKNYSDGSIGIGDPRFPRSHSGHANGGIDFNPGAKLPVHAMVDGEVTFLGAYSDARHYASNSAGYYVEIKSTNFGYNGTVYMRYLELGYLESPFGEALGINSGPNGTSIRNKPTTRKNVSIQVRKGDIIGYTNDIGGGQSQLHIDLQRNPTLSGGGSVSSNFPFTPSDGKGGTYGTGYTVVNGNWYQDGKLVGVMGADGKAKTPRANFDVFNHYWYCTILTTPKAISSSTSPDGGIPLSPSVNVPSDPYLNLSFSNRYMGEYPSQITDINNSNFRGIKTLALAARGEFGLNEEGKSYGKLFRTWILHEVVRFPSYGNFRDVNATVDTFAKYWSDIVYYSWGGSRYMSAPYWDTNAPETEEFLEFMQSMYLNVAHPDIFGINKQSCITACNNMPYSNETTALGTNIPVTRGSPLVFSVVEKYSGGWYVMYRTQAMSDSFLTPNPAVYN